MRATLAGWFAIGLVGFAGAACSSSSAGPPPPGGGGNCTPTTSCLGVAQCGTIPDGCGGVVQCAVCPSPLTCGTGMTPGYCSACSTDGWCSEDPIWYGQGSMTSVFARTATDVWFTGPNGAVWEWDGAWHDRSVPLVVSVTGDGPTRIWAANAADVWGVNWRGIWHYDGAHWTLNTHFTSLKDIWGVAWNDIWVVGGSGATYHFDGSGWAAKNTGVPHGLMTVFGLSSNDVWAAGAGAIILHWDGLAWSQLTPGTEAGYVSVIRVAAPSEVWVIYVGADTSDLRSFANGVFSIDMSIFRVDTPTGLWVFGMDDLWIATAEGKIKHLGTTGWVDSAVPSTSALVDLTAAPNGDLWAVGTQQTMRVLRRTAP